MIVLNTGIILILVTLFSGCKLKPIYGFLVIFVIMAFQSNIEGDFVSYMQDFDNGVTARTASVEPMWQFLNRSLRPIGSLAFNILLTLFELVVLFRLVKKYTETRYIFLVAILFFFTNSMMMIYMKAIRQTCAMSFCLLPFLFDYAKIHKGRWLYVFIPLLIAVNIHNSSLICLPILLLFYMQLKFKIFDTILSNKKNGLTFAIVMTFLYCMCYYGKDSFLNTYMVQLSQLMAENDMRLANYADMSEVKGEIFNISWLIVLYDGFIVFVSSWYLKNATPVKRIFVIMTIFASFWDMLFFGMGSLMRVGYYFSIVNIVVLPNIAFYIERKLGKRMAMYFVIVCVAYAIKTTLPSFTSMDPVLFGNYKFIFLK